jgi:hypothetical protein
MNHYGNSRSRRVPARYTLLGAVIVVVLLASILAALTTPAGVAGPPLIGR